MGRIRRAQGEPRPRDENQRAISRCQRRIELALAQAESGAEKFLQTGPRWRSLESVSFGADTGAATRSGSLEAVAKLRLPTEFHDDLKTLPLHPALVDRATSWAIVAMAEGTKCLPFAYKKIRIHKPLPPGFYSYAKLQTAQDEEFLTFDFLLVNDEGDALVEIEGYDFKRMRGQVFADAGAAAGTQTVAAPRREKLGDCILSKEGIDVFERIIAMPPMPQIIVATKEFSHVLAERQPKDVQAAAEATAAEASAPAAVYSRPNLGIPYVAPRNELEDSIAKVWSSLLGIDKVGVDDDFLELGGHSLLAIQLAARVREMFEMDLSVAKLYNARTVAGLARVIVETLTSEADPAIVEQVLREIEVPSESTAAAAN
jgi:acyl carrier protein